LTIDPDGKLIGEVVPDELEKKLEPVSLQVKLPRMLDRNITIAFNDPSLKVALANLKMSAHAEFELDNDSLKTLGTRTPPRYR
jgi:hypothetical protein